MSLQSTVSWPRRKAGLLGGLVPALSSPRRGLHPSSQTPIQPPRRGLLSWRGAHPSPTHERPPHSHTPILPHRTDAPHLGAPPPPSFTNSPIHPPTHPSTHSAASF